MGISRAIRSQIGIWERVKQSFTLVTKLLLGHALALEIPISNKLNTKE